MIIHFKYSIAFNYFYFLLTIFYPNIWSLIFIFLFIQFFVYWSLSNNWAYTNRKLKLAFYLFRIYWLQSYKKSSFCSTYFLFIYGPISSLLYLQLFLNGKMIKVDKKIKSDYFEAFYNKILINTVNE